jgi:hypothetical protein
VTHPLLLLLLILLVEGFYWDQSSSMILLHSRQGKAKQASKQASKASKQQGSLSTFMHNSSCWTDKNTHTNLKKCKTASSSEV